MTQRNYYGEESSRGSRRGHSYSSDDYRQSRGGQRFESSPRWRYRREDEEFDRDEDSYEMQGDFYDEGYPAMGAASSGYSRELEENGEQDFRERSRRRLSAGSERPYPSHMSQRSSYDRGDNGREQEGQNFAGRGPKNYRRSDERIREEVCEALTDHPHVDASQTEVEVRDGQVTLSGTVSSRAMKRLMEEEAECVRGVCDVTNQLRIERDQTSQEMQAASSFTLDAPKAGTNAQQGMHTS